MYDDIRYSRKYREKKKFEDDSHLYCLRACVDGDFHQYYAFERSHRFISFSCFLFFDAIRFSYFF